MTRPRRPDPSQVAGIGVARLRDSPLREARIVPECEDWACRSADEGHSSIASSSAAVFTTSCR
ncbi:MAG TPA: hypothetical protein VGR10_07450, partial [Thermoleophilaceae bacterium]|nr:hypothetical protein [Thermoleophilaceae bacterium]